MPERVAAETMVVVLGAGINGAALARELLLSGVRVIVVEADDVACGATAWSTRLVHGGLRYLEYGETDLVRESLAERDRLVRLAPHLVRRLGFLLPVRGRWGDSSRRRPASWASSRPHARFAAGAAAASPSGSASRSTTRSPRAPAGRGTAAW